MKKLILTAIAVTSAVSVFAQGQVSFNNRSAGNVITHVYLGGTSQIVGNGANDYSDTTLTPGTTDWAGYTAVSGSGFFAQLLGAPGSNQTESSLLPSSPTTTFRTGAAAGFVNPTTSTFANIAVDAAVGTIEMVAWDNSTGLYPTWTQARSAWQQGLIAAGASGTINVLAIGGGLNPAPTLNGLQSFNIYGGVIPEPTTFALLGLGGAAMLIFRRRK